MGGMFFLFWGGKLNNEKKYKNKIRQRPYMAANQYFTCNNQPKTSGRDGGGMG
jgi:hypothetical protein